MNRRILGHDFKKNCAASGGFQVAFPLTHMNRQQTTNTPAIKQNKKTKP